MSRWMKRARGALVLGTLWALAWAPVGVLVGLVVDPDGRMDEPWLLVGAIPGFLGGVAFALLLGLVARRRRVEELSTARAAGWGALAGLGVGIAARLVGTPAPGLPWWLLPLVTVAIAAMAALSAAGSLALAKRGARRERAMAGE